MKAALLHFYSARNVGDAAIEAALQRLTGCDSLPALGFDERSRAATHDCLISVGGDIFNNGRPGLLTRRFLAKLGQLRWAPERSLLFGQSIPPSCDGIALRLLAYRLNRIASVTLRDTRSVERLALAGCAARLSADLVFALDAGEADTVRGRLLFREQGLAPESTALFSVRNFNRMYRVDQGRFMVSLAKTIRRVADHGFAPAVLLQADVDDDDSDLVVVQQLREFAPQLRILNPFNCGGTPWRVALGAVGEAGTVVGTRYHTAVFRMICGRMPVGLWYSNKGADLHQRFGVPGAEAGSFDPDTIAAHAVATSGAAFDAAPLRRRVRKDFAAALATIDTNRAAA